MENKFYLVSRHGNCGTNVMFHFKDGCGYGTDISKLHLFSLEDAQNALDHDIRSVPLLASEVFARSIESVDTQYMDKSKNCCDSNGEYVIQFHGVWNGNDAMFQSECGGSFDYGKATVFNIGDALRERNVNGVIWSKEYIDTLKRRTFQAENISTRKMITGAGIKYKKPRKPRPTSGKERWNCPCCGRIVWQFNPYDFDHCNNINCELWGC